MQEINDVHSLIQPDETLLVADSMTGQEAVNIASKFHETVL